MLGLLGREEGCGIEEEVRIGLRKEGVIGVMKLVVDII